MAEKKSFKDKVNGYADQYEDRAQENMEAFIKVSKECVTRGLKTVEQVYEEQKWQE